jgi:septation ring formation regulator EzrA
MNFTSKETYLTYRADWKAQYKQLSTDIRKAKHELKTAQREGTATWRHFRACSDGKVQAREMLEQLTTAKIEVQRLYLAQRNS